MHVVSTTIEMPEGAELSDPDDNNINYDPNDPHRALDIDLEEPVISNRVDTGSSKPNKNGQLKLLGEDGSKKKEKEKKKSKE